MELLPLLKGLSASLPGIRNIRQIQHREMRQPASYFYGVWLKYLTLLWKAGMREIPETLVEFGPGDSLGTGLAAMLSGTRHYYGLDVAPYAKKSRNLAVFEELLPLFQERAGRPTKGWPDFDDDLDVHLFPAHILTKSVLEKSLNTDRVTAIRRLLQKDDPASGFKLKYFAPWEQEASIPPDSVDLIVSHSVLEHVMDLEGMYRSCYRWLKPGGMMAHQIDFRSHGLTKTWNGQWGYSAFWWKMLFLRRPEFLNRQPCSVHLEFVKSHSFTLETQLRRIRRDGLVFSALPSIFRHFQAEDLICSGLFLIARKV